MSVRPVKWWKTYKDTKGTNVCIGGNGPYMMTGSEQISLR